MNLDILVKNNLKGVELEKEGKVVEAIVLYEKNVSERFVGNHPYDRLAIIYRKNKDFENEIRVLKTAIDVFENDVSESRADRKPKLAKFNARLKKAEQAKNKLK